MDDVHGPALRERFVDLDAHLPGNLTGARQTASPVADEDQTRVGFEWGRLAGVFVEVAATAKEADAFGELRANPSGIGDLELAKEAPVVGRHVRNRPGQRQ